MTTRHVVRQLVSGGQVWSSTSDVCAILEAKAEELFGQSHLTLSGEAGDAFTAAGRVLEQIQVLLTREVLGELGQPVFGRAAQREARCPRERGHEPHRWFDDRYGECDPAGRCWCPGLTSAEECVIWAREREADGRAARTWGAQEIVADHLERRGSRW